MFGEPKGYIIIDKELKHTKEPGIGPDGKDLTEAYFNALKLKMVPVIDIATDGDSYLVLGNSPEIGGFLWSVDKRDTISKLIPYNILHPEPLLSLVQKIVYGAPLTMEDLESAAEEIARRIQRAKRRL